MLRKFHDNIKKVDEEKRSKQKKHCSVYKRKISYGAQEKIALVQQGVSKAQTPQYLFESLLVLIQGAHKVTEKPIG